MLLLVFLVHHRLVKNPYTNFKGIGEVVAVHLKMGISHFDGGRDQEYQIDLC
jgi:hypothetical protein